MVKYTKPNKDGTTCEIIGADLVDGNYLGGYCISDHDTDDGYCKSCHKPKTNPYCPLEWYE